MTRKPCPTHHQNSFGEEIKLVHQLIAQGDRPHALHHCVGALGLEPNQPHWKAPLRELLRDAKLVERLRNDVFFGAQAARAFHLQEIGSHAEAIALIAEIHRAVPHLGFHRWLGAWVEEVHTEGLAIDPSPLIRVLMVGTSFGVGRMRLLAAEREAAEELVPIARVAMALLPDDGRVAFMASSVMRRAGLFDEALNAAEQAKTTAPSEHYQIVRGLALRASKAFDDALAAFDAAFASSGDAAHLMEKVRVLADAGRWAEALHEWARFQENLKAENESPNQENLLEYETIKVAAERNAPSPAEPPLDVVRRRALGHGQLWPMLDATANALRQLGQDEGLRAKGPTGAGEAIRKGSIKMAVSGPEGPSNRLCQALMLAGEPTPALATYSNTGSPVQLPSEVTKYTLWRWDGDVIAQALPAPRSDVSDWIEGVALHELDGSVSSAQFETATDFLDMWNISSARPPPTATARDWVSATVHPRMPIIRVCCGPDWVYRWQVAALIGLAFSESGWKGTARREAFTSLLNGPVDWPLAATIRVLAEVALREPGAIKEIREALIDLTYKVGSEQNDGIVHTLLSALEMIPYVPKEYVDRLRSQVSGNESTVSEGAVPPGESARPAPRKRPWWKFWATN